MSVNKFRDHLIILPEDDANQQLANGFLSHPAVRWTQVQVEPSAGGWRAAGDKLVREHLPKLTRLERRRVLLLVDFDEVLTRREEVCRDVPAALRDRVFVIGTWSNPEKLKAELGARPFERIGEQLAEECASGVSTLWEHELLVHNRDEVARMRDLLRPLLF